MHILSFVTDNNPSGMISGREENDRRNNFMINLHESMGPDRDRTRNPWICSRNFKKKYSFAMLAAIQRDCLSLSKLLYAKMVAFIMAKICIFIYKKMFGIA